MLPADRGQPERLGPYWRVRLDLPQLFGDTNWSEDGLRGEALKTPIVKMLMECNHEFQKTVTRGERQAHGYF